jgi:hypothetical protein
MKIISIALLLLLFMAGCSGENSSNHSDAINVLDNYLQAFTEKNEAGMSKLVCEDWSSEALLEYDAFQSVKTQLEGLSCKVSGSEDDAVLITCQGKILASYQNEAQEFNLCKRIYRLEKAGPDWLVCGYSKPLKDNENC